jgi:hypothetical protein
MDEKIIVIIISEQSGAYPAKLCDVKRLAHLVHR